MFVAVTGKNRQVYRWGIFTSDTVYCNELLKMLISGMTVIGN